VGKYLQKKHLIQIDDLSRNDIEEIFSLAEYYLQFNKNEVDYKRNALLIYKSERKNLNYIEIKREVYRPIIKYNYNSVPHTGTLFYKRFGIFAWHPRVDSTDPKDICKIINTYKYLDEF